MRQVLPPESEGHVPVTEEHERKQKERRMEKKNYICLIHTDTHKHDTHTHKSLAPATASG
jgi:hypothetical protein